MLELRRSSQRCFLRQGFVNSTKPLRASWWHSQNGTVPYADFAQRTCLQVQALEVRVEDIMPKSFRQLHRWVYVQFSGSAAEHRKT